MRPRRHAGHLSEKEVEARTGLPDFRSVICCLSAESIVSRPITSRPQERLRNEGFIRRDQGHILLASTKGALAMRQFGLFEPRIRRTSRTKHAGKDSLVNFGESEGG